MAGLMDYFRRFGEGDTDLQRGIMGALQAGAQPINDAINGHPILRELGVRGQELAEAALPGASDVLSMMQGSKALMQGKPGEAAYGALGVLPFVPNIAGSMKLLGDAGHAPQASLGYLSPEELAEAKLITGRQAAGDTVDSGLSTKGVEQVARGVSDFDNPASTLQDYFSGKKQSRNSPDAPPMGIARQGNQYTGKAHEIAIRPDLSPIDRMKTTAHEVGHVGDFDGYAKATMATHWEARADRERLQNELHRVSQYMRPELWTRGASPLPIDEAARKYAGGTDELYADAQSLYSVNPAHMKRAFPEAAALVRLTWNKMPHLRKELAFNSLAGGAAAGLAAGPLFQELMGQDQQ